VRARLLPGGAAGNKVTAGAGGPGSVARNGVIMRFSTFLFPDSRDSARDGQIIDETVREAILAERLGADVVWLAEHHFDGISVYGDPMVMAGALAASLAHAALGFAVIQTALHHPIRLAEQMALLDHLLKGRLIVGLGRGSSYNIYDYQGFGLDHREAQARLDEAEAIMMKAWDGGSFAHDGKFWQLKVPMLRPLPYTKPHPPVIRASSGDASLIELARQGKPWMMNVQSLETTSRRVGVYRQTMREVGYGDAEIAARLGECWVWRNFYVADSEEEASRVGIPAFETMTRARAEMRDRIFAETGERIVVAKTDLPGARTARGDGLIHGTPAHVAEDVAALDRLGIGGIIGTFRLGPMPHEVAAQSLTLFMEEVAPQFRGVEMRAAQ
jgi:alkanesulfonate monooxygenase SsuD/methylene tetrahydromethanopterin reductase-like flavin-dependent oxidoreductase (luciferase family)